MIFLFMYVLFESDYLYIIFWVEGLQLGSYMRPTVTFSLKLI